MYFLLFIFLHVKSNTKDNNIFYYEREKVYNIMSFFFHLQRDLDFTIEVDFKGELSEMKETMQYKMR